MKNVSIRLAQLCAVLLVFADFYSLVGIGSSNTDGMVLPAYLINYMQSNLLGLWALLGCTFFAVYFDKKAAKPLCTVTATLGVLNVVIRLACIVYYIAEGFGFDKVQTVEFSKYAAFMLIAAAVFFLSMYIRGKQVMISCALFTAAAFITYFAQLVYSVSLMRIEAFTLLSVKESVIILSVCGIVIYVLGKRFNITAVDKR